MQERLEKREKVRIFMYNKEREFKSIIKIKPNDKIKIKQRSSIRQ